MGDGLTAALGELGERTFRAYNNWHGALWAHIADLTPEQAAWRPAPGRHCIWEIVRHLANWRRYVVAWYAGSSRPDPEAGNWTMPDATDETTWRADLEALDRTQQDLTHLFAGTDEEALLAPNPDGSHNKFVYVAGLLNHDSYHTGQIAVLRALQGLPPID
ncbi:MAG: DinB family protein [Armatimonadetes bacterium]|nr:DinB family protein [Armatimonadota bacterium]